MKKSQYKKPSDISAYDNSKVNFKTGKSIASAVGPKKMKSVNSPTTKTNNSLPSSASIKTPKTTKSLKAAKNSKPTDAWWNGVQNKEEPHHLYHHQPKPQNSLKELAMKPAPVRYKHKVCIWKPNYRNTSRIVRVRKTLPKFISASSYSTARRRSWSNPCIVWDLWYGSKWISQKPSTQVSKLFLSYLQNYTW